MMKTQLLAVTLLGLSVLAGGCTTVASPASNSASAIETSTNTTQANSPQTMPIISPDGTFALTVPVSWQTDEITEFDQRNNMVLKLSTQQGRIEIGIMTTPTLSVPNKDIYTNAILNAAQSVVGDGGVITTSSLTTVNGMPAIQYEGTGKFGERPISVIMTGVETADTYYTFFVTGYETNLESLRNEVVQVIESFQLQ
jgi:hypothetical protein